MPTSGDSVRRRRRCTGAGIEDTIARLEVQRPGLDERALLALKELSGRLPTAPPEQQANRKEAVMFMSCTPGDLLDPHDDFDAVVVTFGALGSLQIVADDADDADDTVLDSK